VSYRQHLLRLVKGTIVLFVSVCAVYTLLGMWAR